MLTRKSLLNKSSFLFSKLSGVDPLLHKNILAMQRLDKIFSSLTRYYPYSTFALDPASLNMVICDIIVNSRKNIVEIGSGISTVVIAKLLEMNGIEASFHSIDADEGWASLINQYLIDEGLTERCKLHYIPLSKSGSHWYDETTIANLKPAIGTIDCLVVDGPIAYLPGTKQARHGALAHFQDLLQERHSIFLDDALRPGEREVIARWKAQFGYDFKTIGSVAVHLNGSHHNIE
ncbi:Methyltransferase domain-containing protein [Dyadobacter soli]|uniref:Methyltransferase domain-containing protein n=1 Tax=Dyadobacter soli TaxID=659014 RepID=A0A1G7CWV4_9BACT|nr:class I SAM-dependent methyltransferase [Dyadobacter soli]SDE43270.1 Methyltransferase domain-containing protein [Dyadobacter soli]